MLGLALICAVVPYKNNRPGQEKPSNLLGEMKSGSNSFSVDKVARFVVNNDSTMLLIDLRSPAEFQKFNIPGSVNIPYKDLLHKDFEGYLDQKEINKIFYGNGDIVANLARTLCAGLGYQNLYVIQGGLNDWFGKVMNSQFKGERITAQENALFETRFKARKLFNEINSLPDSLKNQYIKVKKKDEKKLDGGCG